MSTRNHRTRTSASKIPHSFLLALSTVFAVVVVTTASANPPKEQNQQMPAALQPCVPSNQVAKTELVSKTRSENTEFYLLSAYEANDTQATDLIISLQGDRCKEVFFNPMGDAIPLANSVGKQVARQLTLGRYQREIKKIGREKFQQQIDETAAEAKQVAWWDEEVWALQQLGLKVPPNVVTE